MTLQNFLRNIERRLADIAKKCQVAKFVAEKETLYLIMEHRISYFARNFAKSFVLDVSNV